MSPPPLLSVTVTEWVPIIVTVNMTTDAEFAVTTPDLRMKDGLSPPPHTHTRITWPLIVSFVNIANCGFANQIAQIQTVHAVPLWIEELLQVTLSSDMIKEGRFECASIWPSGRFLDLCKAVPRSILETLLEPNRQQYYCDLSPSKNSFFLMPHNTWQWLSLFSSSHLQVGPPSFADHFLWAPQFPLLSTVPHRLRWNGSW